MANNIDERIVEMQFDNKQFSEGVRGTLKDLDDLKNGLKLEDMSAGFEKLDKAVQNVNLNPLQNGVEVVQQRFSALEVVAISALSRITNQAMSAGERLVKSFTVDPVTSGFDKYEQKVASVQKIVNSAAENNIENVTAALDKIEWFTNETSYQFDAMVSTLGSFSAAGIPLEKATDTIIGLANAAAISGVNASDASHAFIGFQRAIGSGSLTLGVWNSFLKTAGFQSQAFIDAAIKAGLEVGTLTGTLDKAQTKLKGTSVAAANFGETLKEDWLTSEVITKLSQNFSVASNELYEIMNSDDYNFDTTSAAIKELGGTLDQYSLKAFKAGQETKTWGDTVEYVRGTVAQTWSKTYELIFGNYEQATKFFSDIVESMYTIFVEGNDKRNEYLEAWQETGQVPFLNGLINSLKIVADLVHRSREFILGLIPPSVMEGVAALSKGFHALTIEIGQRLGIKGLATSITEIAGKVEDAVDVADGAVEKAEEIKEVVGDISELATKVIRGDFGNGAERKTALEALGHSYEAVQNKVNELLGCSFRYLDAEGNVITMDHALAESTQQVAEETEEQNEESEKSTGIFDNLASTLSGVMAIVKLFGNAIGAVIRVGARALTYVVEFGKGILGLTGSLGDLVKSAVDFVDQNDLIFKALNKIADVIGDTLRPALEGFLELMESLKDRTNPFIQGIENARASIEQFAGSINLFGDGSIFSKIKSNIATAFGHAGEDFAWLATTISNAKIFEKVAGGVAVSIGAIGKAISMVGSIIQGKNIDIIGDKSGFFGAIETWYNKYAPKLPSFTKTWNNFWKSMTPKGGFKEMYDSVKKKGWQSLLPKEGFFFGDIAKFEKGYKEYKVFFDELFKDLQNTSPIFAALTKGADNLVALFKMIAKAIGDIAMLGFGKLKGLLAPVFDVFEVLAGRISNFPFDKILRIVTMLGYFVLAFKALSALKSVTGFLNSFKDIGDSISGFFKSLERKAYAGIALSIAIAIGILAGAFYALSQLSWDQIKKGLAALGECAGILVASLLVVWLITKADTKSTLFAVLAMAAVVAAIGGIIAALYFVKDLKDSDFVEGLKRLAIIFGALIGVMLIVSALGKGKAIDVKSMAALYVFVMSVGKVLPIIQELADMPFNQMLQGIFGLYAVTAALVILAGGLNGLKFTNSLGLVALVGAIWLFIQLLKDIAKEDIVQLTMGLIKLIPAFVALFALAKIASIGGEGTKGLAASLLAMGIAIKIIGSVIEDLGSLGVWQLTKGIVAVGLIMGGMTAMMSILTKQSKMMAFFGKGAGGDMAKSFIALAASIFIIGLAIENLSKIDFLSGMGAAAMLGVVILAVGKALQYASTTFKGGAGKILAFTAVIAVITGSLMILTTIPMGELFVAATSLAMVIAAVGFALISLEDMDLKRAITSVVTVGAILAEVVAALWVLTEIGDSNIMLQNAEAISLIVGVIGGVIGALTKFVGVEAGLSMIGVAAELGAAIDVLVGIIGAFAWAAGEWGDGEAIKKGLDIMVMVFEKLGEMVGGVIKGFTDPLPAAGKNLSDFADNLKKFVDTFSQNDWLKIGGHILTFSEAMKKLKSIDLKGYDFVGYSAAMSSLATGLATFNDIINTQDVNVTKTERAANSVQTLAEVLSDPIVFDSVKWANFGTAIKSLGESLVAFNEVIAPENAFNPERVDRFIDIFNRLITMAQRMGAIEGFKGFGVLLGETDPSTGLDSLGRLAKSIVKFNQEVGMTADVEGALNIDRVLEVLDVVDALAKAAQKVPTVRGFSNGTKSVFEGFMEFFGGATKQQTSFLEGLMEPQAFSWDTLASGLGGLGTALTTFAENCATIDTSEGGGLAKGLSAIEQFTSLDLPVSVAGQMEKFFFGDSTLDGFAGAITELGNGLKGFYDNTKDLDTEKLKPSLEMIDTILGIPASFEKAGITSNDGGVAISLSTWGSNLVTFSEQFVRAMNILNDFATSHTDQNGNSTIASFIGGLFDSLVNAFNPETIPLLSEIGAAIDEAVAEGMGSDEEAIRLGANRLTDALKNNINSETTLSVFRSAGDKLREHLTDKGFFSESSQARAEEVARLIRGKMSLQLSSKEAYDMFYNAGANLANGLIAGFNSKQGDAKTAATEMASSMNEAFTDAEIEHSPSRVWTGFGSNLVQGLINGVYDQTDNAISAVGYLAKAINGEIEDKSSLRITPVVDMNSASASATKLNNMFDSNRAAALSATMELNSQVTQIDQLVDVTNRILGSIQNGSDLYLDDRVLAGRINRRLGAV